MNEARCPHIHPVAVMSTRETSANVLNDFDDIYTI